MPDRRIAIAILSLAAIALARTPDEDIDPEVRPVLLRDFKFSARELADLERGKTVKHSIDAKAPGEIAVAGATRVRASKRAFVDRVRDIVRFKRGPDVVQIGRFSDPPQPNDLAALTVDARDFDVRTCRVRDCGVRLPAALIQRFVREIDRRDPRVQQRVETMFKQVLLDEATAYGSGADRILQYDDGPQPIRPIDDFNAILLETPSLGMLEPGLPDHLRDFPARRLAGSEDLLYWSKEKFGAEPFITITHVTIACPTVRTCVITTKDVYSSRYIDASLALTIATDTLADANTFYLVYVNRSRANALKGGFAALRGSLAGRRARSRLEHDLRGIKGQLEAAR